MDDTQSAQNGAKRHLVQDTADQMREKIYAQQPGEHLGSLTDLAHVYGVGIVTIQQAARILEHEGLLDVRRGPGGGYFGRRPDMAILERALAGYLRTDPASWEEILDMTSLLFIELTGAAAQCIEDAKVAELRQFRKVVELCETQKDLGNAEQILQDLLFTMVNRPLFKLLTRVTLSYARNNMRQQGAIGAFEIKDWREGRLRILDAIITHDAELARFEAHRSNRRVLMSWLQQKQS